MQGEVYSESAADGIIGQSAALKAVLTLASRIRRGYMDFGGNLGFYPPRGFALSYSN